ncbi:hypothetical protein [Campylobacter canadensis]|uniref:Integral membrane protein n=1 Tax=Campylobacter canadensis TaxID=449520 RepID=A0ABS7WSW1_9BACT|nr:hypothetical protein [Campylobacter canadensis]MBZ7987139.1 hypothetical protein [Campylobacter canadensis]MBZ7998237.1 hypothetical protein [Campylobacter canadensis]
MKIKKLILSLLLLEIIMNLYFFSAKIFASSLLAILASLIIPLLSYYSIKKRLVKFVVAQKPRFLIQNLHPVCKEEKKKSFSLSYIKHSNLFFSTTKFFSYFIFSIAILVLINHNLFSVITFFVTSLLTLILLVVSILFF